MLRKQGLEIALTTYGLTDKKKFRQNLRLALDRGLSEADALAALTTVPAKLCGVAEQLGTIGAGKLACLTIVDRDYNGDYGMPRWGDYAVVKVKEGSEVPDLQFAGLFDESWRLPVGRGSLTEVHIAHGELRFAGLPEGGQADEVLAGSSHLPA